MQHPPPAVRTDQLAALRRHWGPQLSTQIIMHRELARSIFLGHRGWEGPASTLFPGTKGAGQTSFLTWTEAPGWTRPSPRKRPLHVAAIGQADEPGEHGDPGIGTQKATTPPEGPRESAGKSGDVAGSR